MNNFKDSLLYLFSIIIVVVVMMISMLFEKGFAFQIFGPLDVFKIVISYILLGLICYQILKGIAVCDKSTLGRNLGIMLFVNSIIYSIMFFSNPNTQIEYFLHRNALNYFFGYFLFSICASFVGSAIFYDYRKEIETKGFHSYVIWRYYIEAIFVILVLYNVFITFVNQLFPNEIFYNNIVNYILVAIITVIFLAIFFFLEKRRNTFEKEIIKESTKAETATANFETLKNQLDPHFLFNSLNVLTGLIEENPEKAVDFTTSLSKIYRYLLEQKDKEVVPLAEELKFAKTYINLLKLRFENSIDFEMNVFEDSESEFIVPLSLQILLENTIKHNSISESKPLKIRIYKEDKHLIVENSYQPKNSIKESTGVGLNNIKKRYELISNQEVVITKDDNLFRVELPILNEKVTVFVYDNSNDSENIAQANKKIITLKKFYQNLLFYLFAAGVSFYYIDNFKLRLILISFIIFLIVSEWIKINKLDYNWEKRKTQEILDKNNHSKKWK